MNASAATQQTWHPSLEAIAPITVRRAPVRRRGGVRSCVIDDRGRQQALRAAGLRLTVRGRWVAGLVFLVLVMVVAGSLGLVVTEAVTSVSAAVADQPVQTKVVQVMPGQTMWQIAQEATPTADLRTTVDQIVELNGLSTAGDLDAGDYLRVPVAAGSTR